MDKYKHKEANELLKQINNIKKELENLGVTEYKGSYKYSQLRLFKKVSLFVSYYCIETLNIEEFYQIIKIMRENRIKELKELQKRYNEL